MLKLIVFTIFVVSSPVFGLLETIFQAENACYSGCRSNYPASAIDVYACKSGCNYKLLNENCADQCKLLSIEEQTQASCIVGCSMNQLKLDDRSPPIATIGLRPSVDINAVEMPNEQSDEQPKSSDLSISDRIRIVFHLTKNIPNDLFNENHVQTVHNFLHRQHDNLQSSTDHLQQYVTNLHGQWTDLVHKQPRTIMWILLSIILLSSIILCYMIVSLCCYRRATNQTLSVRAHELVFDNTFEKEQIQPAEHYYDMTQSVPLKIKLANI